jgi:hypothetical protein
MPQHIAGVQRKEGDAVFSALDFSGRVLVDMSRGEMVFVAMVVPCCLPLLFGEARGEATTTVLATVSAALTALIGDGGIMLVICI